MSYVDAHHDKKKSEIYVVERDANGNRVYQTYPAEYVFYYGDMKGKHKTIFGNTVSKFQTNDRTKFQKELAVMRGGRRIYESDVDPLFRCLADNYLGQEAPELHVSILDIEVNFDPKRGFSTIENPYAEINAISVYNSWMGELVTLALKPNTITEAQAQEVVRKFDNTLLCTDEAELLRIFLDLIEDADVLTGWNSEFFDIPYIIERIKIVLGADYTSKMCLWGLRPTKREIEKFGRVQIAYDLIGKTSLDYLDLFKKHSMQQYHSYRLDFIGEQEVGEKKIAYDGTLDQLYKKDFYKFIEYNRQDVSLLVKIDNKNKFIDLANQVAHTNGVLLKTTMGSVQLIDQAIINEAHRRGMVVQDKIRTNNDEELGAAGAYVADPKVGLHEEIGAVDINSLYPSVIRSLNMCTETLVGQIAQTETEKLIRHRMDIEKMSAADAWHGMFGSVEYTEIFNRNDSFDLCLELGNINDKITKRYMSADEAHDFIFNPNGNYCISANGTIFRTDIEGVIPGLLTKWYKERQEMQAKKKAASKAVEACDDPKEKKKLELEVGFWDKRQYVRKILLNSLYGALLNAASRFYDHRLGQSVTLTGRCITRHMGSEINQLLTGKYDHQGDAVIYGDTDSIYFSAAQLFDNDPAFKEVDWSREKIVKFYDEIGEAVNGTFSNFMKAAFNVPAEKSVIAAGRELIASKGLFIKKKRYAVLIYDMEGWRVDLDPKFKDKGGKIKAMGLDTKRTDTPKPIQDFLTEILQRILSGQAEDDVLNYISEFREDFKTWPAYLKGRPSSANKLDLYTECFNNPKKKVNGKKPTIPGHIRASIHWNMLREAHGDNYSLEITDGMKIITCKLKKNPMGWESIAYPVDEMQLPEWFTELQFDSSGMEDKIIDQKLENLIGVLNWDLDRTRQDSTFGNIFVLQSKK